MRQVRSHDDTSVDRLVNQYTNKVKDIGSTKNPGNCEYKKKRKYKLLLDRNCRLNLYRYYI